MENPIAQEIILDEYKYEWLVAIPSEVSLSPIVSDVPTIAHFAILVYRFDRKLNRSHSPYVYKFVGVRIDSLPNTGLQADVVVCPWCKSTKTYSYVACVGCGAHFHHAAKA